MPRTTTPATKRSRKPIQAKVVQHRHFRLTPLPHRHMDIVTMAVLIIGIFIELVIMTSVPLGVSLFELNRRYDDGQEAKLAVRSQLTYQRWYRDEIQSFIPSSFFSLDAITDKEVKETERIHRRLLEMKVSRVLQEAHLGLVVLASRKQAYLSQAINGTLDEQKTDALQKDLDAFRTMYYWLDY